MTFHARFTANGIPKAQPRPRAFAVNGKARVFDAGTAEGWKAQVAVAARPHAPKHPLDGAIGVMLTFYLPRPKSRCRKSDRPDWICCTSKPDVDNLAKAVLDCLTQQGWWTDDARVYNLSACKRYHAIGMAPGCVIEVYEMQEELQ